MKVPKAKKLPSGQWRVQVMVRGARMSFTDSDEKQAIKKAVNAKADSKIVSRPMNITLEKAIDQYISSRSNTLSPSTIRGYDIIRRTRFKAYMKVNLSQLNEIYCQKMINAEAIECSPKTLKNAWRFISACIFEVTRERINVTLPQAAPPEFKFLDYTQIEKFVDAIRGRPVEIPALLALSSMRRSEIIALDWKNVDLGAGKIVVKGAAVFNKDQKLVQKTTNKNQSSTRIIPIMMPQLMDALNAIKVKSGAVVTQHPNTLLEQINSACDAAGVPRVGVHGLRHSFASLAYHLNVPEKIAMEIGGWSNDATMSKIYTHIARSDMAYYQNKMSSYYQELHTKLHMKNIQP